MIFRYIRLYWTLLKFRINRQLIFSFSFWTGFTTEIALFITQLAVFSTIFSQVDSINGWSYYQVVFFIGTFTIIDGLYMIIYFFGLMGIPDKIRSGQLDIYLVKPANALFLISFESMDLSSVFVVVTGVIMTVYSSMKLGIVVSLWKVIGYLFLLLAMCTLLYCMMAIKRILAFWFYRVDSLYKLEGELLSFCYRIPGIIFKGFSKVIFYVLLPYGIIATLPTQFFTEFLEIKYWVLTLSVCIINALVCEYLWKQGLKRYSSASS